ncbi:hypothetical protein LTS18_003509 [Coniosporium uncinatum]|uniref:Uncharacterized protein n=1 Tax=Coniosporium uncinatum TaxID=93489 RepID=A0ACC3D6J7_9PEZI|nr:hypothetical protein LTS18_003509 [Coniosporium uncinatum]
MAPRNKTSQSESLGADDPPTSINPYKVLGIEKDTSADQVKSAYRKAALRHHPDKAAPEEKETAHTKFQEVAFAYAILSDERRRSRYDTTGRTEDSVDIEDDDFNWTDFFRTQFKEVVSSAAINKFRDDYKGGDEEKESLLEAYVKYEGDLDGVYEDVMLSNPLEDEERFRKIIDAAIKDGRVEAYTSYTKETKMKRKKRMNAAKGEATEALEMAKEMGVDEQLFSNTNSKTKGKKGKKDAEEDQAGLAALIQQRQKGRADNFLADLEAKYAGGAKDRKKRGSAREEPPEEAFQKTTERTKRTRKILEDQAEVEEDAPKTGKRLKTGKK